MDKSEYKEVHQNALVVDGHCDTVYLLGNRSYDFAARNDMGHVDVPRLEEGGVNIQFFALFPEARYKPVGAMKRAMILLHRITGEIERNRDRIQLAGNHHDAMDIYRQGKIAVFLSIEGGDALEDEEEVLDIFYTLGVRSLGLTWNNRNSLADGVGEKEAGGGLTALGKRVVKRCNLRGILLDLAHISPRGFSDAIRLSTRPVVVSHANARKLCPHPRNLSDDQLRMIRDQEGVIGITFYPQFIGKDATMDALIDHFVHIAHLIGPQYIGLGSDFDGIKETLPPLRDVSRLPVLTKALLGRGFSREETKMILGENFMRVIEATIQEG